MTLDRKIRHAIQLVETAEEFDANWYLARYRDVGMMGMSPAEHYIRLGARLLRDPGPGFSTRHYLSTYPDVARASINPFVHYLVHGRKEGRHPVAPASTETQEAILTVDQ
jgi:hypothetical protein